MFLFRLQCHQLTCHVELVLQMVRQQRLFKEQMAHGHIVWFDQSGTPISTTPNSFVNSNTATNLAVGNYSVVISDASGCTSTNDVSIVNPVLVTPTFDPLGVICEGDPINLYTTSIEGINGIWDPAPNSNASQLHILLSLSRVNVQIQPLCLFR